MIAVAPDVRSHEVGRDVGEQRVPGVRAGIHTGECDVTDGALSGPPIRVAAHVAALAHPDEVLITSTVRDLIAGTHLTFIPHDVAQLPGTQDEGPLYAIINTDQSPGP